MFSSAHGKNQFHSAYTVIRASRRLSMFSLPHGETRFHSNSRLTVISIFSRLTAIIDFSLPHGNSPSLSRQHHHLFGLSAAPLWRYQTRQSLSSPGHTAPSGFWQAAGPVDQRWCCFFLATPCNEEPLAVTPWTNGLLRPF